MRIVEARNDEVQDRDGNVCCPTLIGQPSELRLPVLIGQHLECL